MTPGIRLVITAFVLCHLLLLTPVVTSQLLPPETFRCEATALQIATPERGAQPAAGEEVTISAREQEKRGDVYHLRGDVQINYRDYQLNADEVDFDQSTGEVTAQGNVVIQGGPLDERLHAGEAHYNVKSQTGSFQQFTGTTGISLRRGRMALTSENPFAFRGKSVEKTGPDRYVVHSGMVTSCPADSPAWSFNAGEIVVNVGSSAKLYNSTFRLHGIPVFYMPFVARPVQVLGRQSGFLIPTGGRSSIRGITFGDSFYWAINRSMDATVGGQYFSRRGWAQTGQFRARLNQNSYFEGHYFGVIDRGLPTSAVPLGWPSKGPNLINQGGREIRANFESELTHNIRAVADLDYLSSYLFRLAFSESFTQAANSEVVSTAFLSRFEDGLALNLAAMRYQNFESPARGDLVTILHMPSFESSTVERPLFGTRVLWSFEGAAEGVSRREPGFVTNVISGRFDGEPALAVPVTVHGWTIRTDAALRDTYYTERLQPNSALGVPLDSPINRRALESSVELRPPTLARIFDRTFFGRKLKHSIEPRATYRYTTGVGNFHEIIRYDARDLLSDTNELEYAVMNRLYARDENPHNCTPEEENALFQPRSISQRLSATSDTYDEPNCDPIGGARQIASWEFFAKSFFNQTFGGAVINGRRNVLTTTVDFSGFAFLTEPRSFSPIASRLRVYPTRHFDVQWSLDYDSRKGRINASTSIAEMRLGEFFIGGSHVFFHAPGELFVTNPVPGPDRFNQYRVLAGYGHPDKHGLSVAAASGVDVNLNQWHYATLQTSYNWQCIGFSVEYRRLALGAVRPNENQLRFSLSLANIGTFGTLRRQESLF
jgi:LPS-assembly protein